MKNPVRIVSMILPVAALAACSPNYPKVPPLPAKAAKAAPFQSSDAAFTQSANENALTQIAMAKLAVDHTQSVSVRDAASLSVKDYTDSRAALAKIAAKHDVTLTDALMADDQRVIDRLSRLYGRTFDRAYGREIQSRSTAFERDVDSVLATTKDADIKAYAGDAQRLDKKTTAIAFSWAPHVSTRSRHRR